MTESENLEEDFIGYLKKQFNRPEQDILELSKRMHDYLESICIPSNNNMSYICRYISNIMKLKDFKNLEAEIFIKTSPVYVNGKEVKSAGTFSGRDLILWLLRHRIIDEKTSHLFEEVLPEEVKQQTAILDNYENPEQASLFQLNTPGWLHATKIYNLANIFKYGFQTGSYFYGQDQNGNRVIAGRASFHTIDPGIVLQYAIGLHGGGDLNQRRENVPGCIIEIALAEDDKKFMWSSIGGYEIVCTRHISPERIKAIYFFKEDLNKLSQYKDISQILNNLQDKIHVIDISNKFVGSIYDLDEYQLKNSLLDIVREYFANIYGFESIDKYLIWMKNREEEFLKEGYSGLPLVGGGVYNVEYYFCPLCNLKHRMYYYIRNHINRYHCYTEAMYLSGKGGGGIAPAISNVMFFDEFSSKRMLIGMPAYDHHKFVLTEEGFKLCVECGLKVPPNEFFSSTVLEKQLYMKTIYDLIEIFMNDSMLEPIRQRMQQSKKNQTDVKEAMIYILSLILNKYQDDLIEINIDYTCPDEDIPWPWIDFDKLTSDNKLIYELRFYLECIQSGVSLHGGVSAQKRNATPEDILDWLVQNEFLTLEERKESFDDIKIEDNPEKIMKMAESIESSMYYRQNVIENMKKKTEDE